MVLGITVSCTSNHWSKFLYGVYCVFLKSKV